MALSRRGPWLSWPPLTEPYSASQKLLRCNYYRDGHSKVIFQLPHSCNHGDGPSAITCLSLFLKDSRRGESEDTEGRDGGDKRRKERESQRAREVRTPRDRERQKHRDREKQRPLRELGEIKVQGERDDRQHHVKDVDRETETDSERDGDDTGEGETEARADTRT